MNINTLIISDFNLEIFGRLLEANKDYDIHITNTTASYNQIHQTFIIENQNKTKRDVAIIWTTLECISENILNYINGNNFDSEGFIKELSVFEQYIIEMSLYVKNIFVIYLSPINNKKIFGSLLDTKIDGLEYLYTKANLHLMETLSNYKNIFIINPQNLININVNYNSWYYGKSPYALQTFKIISSEIIKLIKQIYVGIKKVIVLDLDNTLWGGIIGDCGIGEIVLGGHDPIGEAFKDFQSKIKIIKNRGFLLCICSKNTEEIAINAIKNHPEMILKIDDFITWRINWKDKAENIIDIAKELNLGLDSFIFIDDNEHERSRVSSALPEVTVLNLPKNPAMYVEYINKLYIFDPPTITDEDKRKTKIYAEDMQRTNELQKLGSVEDWLKTLNLYLKIEKVNNNNISRAWQLLNKTNQMNLSTRRMPESEFKDWVCDQNNSSHVFSAKDKFGDYGIIGLLSITNNTVVDFILSCRAMGKNIEHAMIGLIGKDLILKYIPTQKNMPIKNFLDTSSYFIKIDTNTYEFKNNTNIIPGYIQLWK